ncbi:diguanylate cyclase [Pseudomonas plecoglossicida]|uniref:Diguanylate cyclase n=1 Tax=Pseudomonas plecoglossicida TaxID=70775 RepID=A0A2A3M9B3_PSEDL|nr:diguanylate cyclase [Pseudomonas plecoglossicida]
MGAGSPANTGGAGATHRVACFAGKPAPTMAPVLCAIAQPTGCACG